MDLESKLKYKHVFLFGLLVIVLFVCVIYMLITNDVKSIAAVIFVFGMGLILVLIIYLIIKGIIEIIKNFIENWNQDYNH